MGSGEGGRGREREREGRGRVQKTKCLFTNVSSLLFCFVILFFASLVAVKEKNNINIHRIELVIYVNIYQICQTFYIL